MPPAEFQDMKAVVNSSGTSRLHRGRGYLRSREDVSASAVNTMRVEEQDFDLQSLWVDLGGEG
jgi:hypothetical protein